MIRLRNSDIALENPLDCSALSLVAEPAVVPLVLSESVVVIFMGSRMVFLL